MNRTSPPAADRTGRAPYRLRLFVAVGERNSDLALSNCKGILDSALGNDYHLEVVNVLTHWREAQREGVLVTPMLLLDSPYQAVVAGDLTDGSKVKKSLMLENQ